MADVKISGLTTKSADMATTDEVEINEGGTSKSVTGANILGMINADNLANIDSASTGLSNLGGLAAASNLSDVGAAATALTNIGGIGAATTETLTNKTLGASTLSGAMAGADQQISRVNLLDYGEIHNAIGSTGGGSQDIDLELGNSVGATVDTSTNTFTFSNPTASDENCGFVLYLTNGGSQTVNWPSSVDWPSATAPTLSASGLDILVFSTIDGGTIWHGIVASTLSS